MSAAVTYPQYLDDIHYSDLSSLNTLRVCLPHAPSRDPSALWLVYIHGGAWCDPETLAASFDNLQAAILKTASISKIDGLASIDYRLSPYPSHKSSPSDPNDPARNAQHPDHINDVLHALLWLQDKYGFGDRYILVGHSCGATLAMQVVMRRYWGKQYESSFAEELNVVPPLAIVGVEGIYDLPEFVREYAGIPAYRAYITNAFSADEKGWTEASPTNGEYSDSWPDGRLLVLAHSDGDELLSGHSRDLMAKSISESGWDKIEGHTLMQHSLTGLKHDEVWEKPEQLKTLLVDIIDLVYTYQ